MKHTQRKCPRLRLGDIIRILEKDLLHEIAVCVEADDHIDHPYCCMIISNGINAREEYWPTKYERIGNINECVTMLTTAAHQAKVREVITQLDKHIDPKAAAQLEDDGRLEASIRQWFTDIFTRGTHTSQMMTVADVVTEVLHNSHRPDQVRHALKRMGISVYRRYGKPATTAYQFYTHTPGSDKIKSVTIKQPARPYVFERNMFI
jgi:hypothetical protein